MLGAGRGVSAGRRVRSSARHVTTFLQTTCADLYGVYCTEFAVMPQQQFQVASVVAIAPIPTCTTDRDSSVFCSTTQSRVSSPCSMYPESFVSRYISDRVLMLVSSSVQRDPNEHCHSTNLQHEIADILEDAID